MVDMDIWGRKIVFVAIGPVYTANAMNLANIRAELRVKRTELETTLEVIASAIAALEGSKRGKYKSTRKRHLSAAGRKRIIAAQKARWAQYKKKRRLNA
jgi:hypothetical protein